MYVIPGGFFVIPLYILLLSSEPSLFQVCAPYVAIIGDASRVSTITNAVYDGYHAALDI